RRGAPLGRSPVPPAPPRTPVRSPPRAPTLRSGGSRAIVCWLRAPGRFMQVMRHPSGPEAALQGWTRPAPPRDAEPIPRDAARALEADLRRRIEGEVRFGHGDRAMYSTDASSYRQMPIGVVIPRTIDDVVETVAACRAAGAPVLSRGGGTSLAGQCCNAAVVIDHSKHLNRILELDRDRKTARVQAGVILDHLRNLGESEEPRLTFGPTPSTHDHCTIG